MAVDTLREIATELGKKDWKFEVNPCSRANTSWRTPSNSQTPSYIDQLDCDHCSGGQCHVVNIYLTGQDLAGVLPKSLAKLPYLKNESYEELSFWYNTTRMGFNFVGDSAYKPPPFSGAVSKELGKITSLSILDFGNNFFSGAVPAELSKLVNLEKLDLSANYFTGKLPKELMNLSNLDTLRISSNNFSGQIPDYFRNWRKLQALEIQSSGFYGPIPTSISTLSNLTELKISDLKGQGSKFPPLANWKS